MDGWMDEFSKWVPTWMDGWMDFLQMGFPSKNSRRKEIKRKEKEEIF
jgi:hypothetical protein